jgi:gas vesicle protein
MENRTKTLFIGALIGAIVGAIAAVLLNRRAGKDEKSTALTTGDGIKLGVLIFGLLRAIASLGDEDKK